MAYSATGRNSHVIILWNAVNSLLVAEGELESCGHQQVYEHLIHTHKRAHTLIDSEYFLCTSAVSGFSNKSKSCRARCDRIAAATRVVSHSTGGWLEFINDYFSTRASRVQKWVSVLVVCIWWLVVVNAIGERVARLGGFGVRRRRSAGGWESVRCAFAGRLTTICSDETNSVNWLICHRQAESLSSFAMQFVFAPKSNPSLTSPGVDSWLRHVHRGPNKYMPCDAKMTAKVQPRE